MPASFIIFIGLGALFIILGCIIPKYPQLLSGYSRLNKDDRLSENGQKAIRAIGKSLIAGGFIIVVSNIVYYIMQWSTGLDMIIIGTILLIVISYIYQVNKLTSNKKTNRIINSIFIILALIISAGFFYSSGEANVSVSTEHQTVNISGLYHQSIPLNDIAKVELTGNLPPLKYRSNGFSFANTKKGYFKTNAGETILLFLTTKTGPYLCITKKTGTRIFINYKDFEKTINIYNQLSF